MQMLTRQHLLAAISSALLAVLVTGCQTSRHAEAVQPVAIRSIDQLHWLAGHWVQESQESQAGRPRYQVNEELWLAPAGGMMLGVNRTLEDGRAVFFEYLMIREVGGRMAYLAMPGGQSPPTVFPMVESSAGMTAIFENPQHDFPQRVVYERQGDRLTATLTGGGANSGLRIEQWTWRRAGK